MQLLFVALSVSICSWKVRVWTCCAAMLVCWACSQGAREGDVAGGWLLAGANERGASARPRGSRTAANHSCLHGSCRLTTIGITPPVHCVTLTV